MTTGSAVVGVPKNWRKLDMKVPHIRLYFNGDGCSTPIVDETGSPLQIGMTVAEFTTDENLNKWVESHIKSAKNNKRLKLMKKEVVEDVELSDGQHAKLLTTEFIKEEDRHSLQLKLFVKTEKSTGWVVSGFIVGGKESKFPESGGPWAKWLTAHLKSLCFDKNKFDSKTLSKAYKAIQA